MTKQTKISLCMIARNEEQWIGQCLESVQGLVDEIILVDTGSKDKTIEIAQSKGAIIHHLEWPNDFSKARNYSLEQASGDWILVLDADEVIAKEDHEKIRKLVNSNEADAYYLVQTNYCEDSATFGWIRNYLTAPEARGYPGYIDSSLVRLFRRRPEIRFNGIIHEHANDRRGNQAIWADIRIHHYGKYSGSENLKRKDNLYLKLGLQKCEARPNDAHTWYELGAQYAGMDMRQEAREALLKAEALDPRYIKVHIVLASLALRDENTSEAISRFLKVMDLDPKDPNPYMYLPHLLILQRQIPMAEKIIQIGNAFAADQPTFFVNSGVVLQSLGNYRRSITLFEHALKLNSREVLAWYNMGLSYLLLEDTVKARELLENSLSHPLTRLNSFRKLAECYFREGRMEVALHTIDEALKEFSEDSELWYQKTVIMIRSKRTNEAKECLLKINPEMISDTHALNSLIQCHRAVGNVSEAEILTQRLKKPTVSGSAPAHL